MDYTGKRVVINDKDSFYHNEWGTIILIDEDGMFHVAIANGKDSCPVFDRSQIRIPRKQ